MNSPDTLSPATALVLVDLIRGLVEAEATGDAPYEARVRRALPNIRRLLDAARGAGVPVIHARVVYRRTPRGLDDGGVRAMVRRQDAFLGVQAPPGVELVEGSPWVEFLDEVRPAPGEYVVRKNRYSAFHGGDFESLLEALGVRRLVVAGVATNFCVRATVMDAFQRGWEVVVPRQAVETYSDRVQEQNLEDMHLSCATVMDLDDVLRLLEGESKA